MKIKYVSAVVKETCSVAWNNKIFDQSARLAFYFLLSLFPFLIVLLLVLGLVVKSSKDVNGLVANSLSGVAPESVVELIQAILNDLGTGASTGRLSLALILSVWSASRSISAIIESLNRSYGVDEFRPWWKRALLAIGLTIGVVLLNAFTFLLVLSGGFVLNFFEEIPLLENFDQRIWAILQWIILFAFVSGVLYLIYRFGPNKKGLSWNRVLPGTLTGVILWLILSYGFQFYLTHFDRFNQTYGSLSAVIILLFWLYFSAAAMLAGGAVNSVLMKNQQTGPNKKKFRHDQSEDIPQAIS